MQTLDEIRRVRERVSLTCVGEGQEHVWRLFGHVDGPAGRVYRWWCPVCNAMYEGTGDGTPLEDKRIDRRYGPVPASAEAPVDPYAKIADEEPGLNRAERRRLARR